MSVHPVILWTDALIYLLIMSSIIFVFWARKQERYRAAWHDVLHNRLAMVAFAVLITYVLIGLADSIHFKYASASQGNNVKSLFDVMVLPLGKQDEKTYSAPFASQLYSKEIFLNDQGDKVHDYPFLHFGGHAVQVSHQSILVDVMQRCFFASMIAILICILVAVLLIFGVVIASPAVFAGRGNPCFQFLTADEFIPWRVLFISFSVIFLLGCNLFYLSHEYHIFGTDKIGQDIFFETLKSIRTGLIIGTLTTLFLLPLAIFFGLLAGYFRGWVDDVIQYIYTTLSSIPDVLLIAAAVLSLQIFILNHPNYFSNLMQAADARLLALCVILGVTSWTNLCRLLRGETLKLREQDYVQAATALGVSRSSILIRHILPNVMHLIIIAAVMDFSSLVLAEAVLTYVGVGVDATTNSWGNMINAARMDLAREPAVWWPLLGAFLFMFPLVISANLFADALRDALDPRD